MKVLRTLPLSLLTLFALGPAPGAAQTPLAARPAASAEAVLAPAGPIRVDIPAGQSQATVPADVAAGQPATFLFAAPPGVALTIGVSSKSNGARLSIYEGSSERALPSTEPEVGCVRWIGQTASPDGLRIVVHTTGEATPVRLEVLLQRDLDFSGKAGD